MNLFLTRTWQEAISKYTVTPIIPCPEGALFGFLFPNTFSEKEGWLEKPTHKNTARAYFFHKNKVKIVTPNNEKETNWLLAYNHIARSTFGQETVPEFLEIEGITPSEKEVLERINTWLKAFKELPGVIITQTTWNEKPALEVSIPSSWERTLTNEKGAEIDETYPVYLLFDGSIISHSLNEKNEDDLLDQHFDLALMNTWSDFYVSLCSYLNDLFNTVPKMEVDLGKENENLKNQKLENLLVVFNQRLSEWVELLNIIPGVKAEIYLDDSKDRLIEISIPLDLDFISKPGNNNPKATFFLTPSGTFEKSRDWHDLEDESDLYRNWKLEKGGSWIYFYNKVVELIKSYTESVPAVPEPANF